MSIRIRVGDYQQVKEYKSLMEVLIQAYTRASAGKGKERHAEVGQPFEYQDICTEGYDFAIGQARKKLKESRRLPIDEAINELLDAIVYSAAGVIMLRKLRDTTKVEAPKCPDKE